MKDIEIIPIFQTVMLLFREHLAHSFSKNISLCYAVGKSNDIIIHFSALSLISINFQKLRYGWDKFESSLSLTQFLFFRSSERYLTKEYIPVLKLLNLREIVKSREVFLRNYKVYKNIF